MRSRVQMMKLMSQFEGLVTAMEDVHVRDSENEKSTGEGARSNAAAVEGKDAEDSEGGAKGKFEEKE